MGLEGAFGLSNIVSSAEKAALEIELAFKMSSLLAYKELTYASGVLTDVDVYEASDKLVKLFEKALTYDGEGRLAESTLTRISDSFTLTKVFAYDAGGNLTSVTRT